MDRERELEMQTIGGVLGGASLGVVHHAEVRNAGAEVGDDGGVVVDGGEGGVVLPVACNASQIGSG